MTEQYVRHSRPLKWAASAGGLLLLPAMRAGQILRLLLVAMLLALFLAANLAHAETPFVLGVATHLTRSAAPAR